MSVQEVKDGLTYEYRFNCRLWVACVNVGFSFLQETIMNYSQEDCGHDFADGGLPEVLAELRLPYWPWVRNVLEV